MQTYHILKVTKSFIQIILKLMHLGYLNIHTACDFFCFRHKIVWFKTFFEYKIVIDNYNYKFKFKIIVTNYSFNLNLKF